MLRRGWKVIALSVGVSLAAAALYLYYIAVPLYQATAQLLIVHHQGNPLNVANLDPNRPLDSGDDYIPTQASIVGSHVIVKRAIDAIGLENLPTLLPAQKKGRNPVEEAIKSHLGVTRPSRMANVLQIDYTARSSGEAIRMVEAIAASYKKFLEESYSRTGEVVALNTKARHQLARELEDAEKQYLEFRHKAPSVIPDEKGRTFVTTRLEQWDKALNQTQAREVQLRAQRELVRKLSKEGAGLWAIGFAMDQFAGQPKGDLLAHASDVAQATSLDYIRQLKQEQQELAERFGPQYSKVQELQEQITRIQERVRESRGRYEQVEVSDLLKSLELSLTVNEEMRAELNKHVEEAKKVETDYLVETRLRTNVERQRAMLNAVVDQLKQAQLTGGFSPVAAEVLQPTTALPLPVSPRTLLTLGVALLLGLAVGSGIVALQNHLDVRLRSADDVREALGLTVLGQLPQEPAARGETAPLASHALPQSGLAEAFKMVRTNLVLLRRRCDLHTLVVTSPGTNEGKTVAASNLAISLANAGQRVLLVDADLRHPSLDRLYGLPGDRGLTQVLQGLCSAADVVQQSSVANLALIPAGPAVASPAELLMSPRLSAFLAEARSRYDAVVLDSSPLVGVTDPCLLAALADGTVLVVREGVTKRKDAEKAVELLKSLDIPLPGVLLNGTAPTRAGKDRNGRCGGAGTLRRPDSAAAATAFKSGNGSLANR